MSENILQIGIYRILRKLGVPRENVAFEADFDKDYFFTEPEKRILFNLVEFKYNVTIPKTIENNTHNAYYLINYIKTTL